MALVVSVVQPRCPHSSCHRCESAVCRAAVRTGADRIPLELIDQSKALAESAFLAAPSGGDPGFGVGDAGGFRHGGNRPGQLEKQPHNMIHVVIGGERAGSKLDGKHAGVRGSPSPLRSPRSLRTSWAATTRSRILRCI